MDDAEPAKKSTVIEYWRGTSDWSPQGRRKEAFDAARKLYEMDRVSLVQKKTGESDYSYRMHVA